MNDGTDDFEEKTTNIYRAFSEKNKSMFREKMLAFDRADEFSKEKKERIKGLVFSRKKEHDKKNITVEGKLSEDKEKIIEYIEKAEEPERIEKSTDQITNEENMILIDGGEYNMGSDNNDEKPIHKVYLDSFYMCPYQVTQNQWKEIMEENPSYFQNEKDKNGVENNNTGKFPVECVSWYDCVLFCNKLSEVYGLTKYYNINGSDVTFNGGARGFRLPTESEWEFAARGGIKSNNYKYSGSNTLDEVGWYYENSDGKTHEAGKKNINELGIYDMSGNVWEWCFDRYGEYDSRPQKNPQGAYAGAVRVMRGGSWCYGAEDCAVSYRYYFTPGLRDNRVGFRLVLPQ